MYCVRLITKSKLGMQTCTCISGKCGAINFSQRPGIFLYSYYLKVPQIIFVLFFISFKIVTFVSGSEVVKLSQNRFNSRTDSKPNVGRCSESSRYMCKHTRNLVGTIEHWSCCLHVMARNGYLYFLLIRVNITVLFNT